jgi:hypothetical protein
VKLDALTKTNRELLEAQTALTKELDELKEERLSIISHSK